MDLGGYSATGPRDANEDSFFECSFPTSVTFLNGVDSFVMVSDGMGGYQGGDVASRLTTSSAERYLANLFKISAGKAIEFNPDVALVEIAGNAHEAIVAETRARSNASMGATFLGAFLSPTHVWIGHVGDSRAYLVRNGEAQQITVDHSQVGRMLSRGVITEEEAQNHPDRNRIERALGFDNNQVEITEVDWEPGDALLLCSDGAYTVLDKQAIASLCMSGRTAKESAKLAVEEALENDTDDNTTVVVARRNDGANAAARPSRATQPTVIQPVLAQPVGEWKDKGDAPQARGQSHQAQREQSIPTQRLKPVAPPAPSAPSQADMAQPMPNMAPRRAPRSRRATRKRPLLPIVVPVVIFVALVGGVVALFVFSQSSSTAGNTASPYSPQYDTSATAADPTANANGNTSTSHYVEEAAPSTSYTVLEDAFLRFIDKDGTAQLFSERFTLTEDPYVSTGSVVSATSREGSFGRYDQNYRLLDEGYLDDLVRDCELYRQGRSEFSSDLSRIVESTRYKELLSALQSIDEASFELEITGLLLRSEDLASASQSSDSSSRTNSTDATGQSETTSSPDPTSSLGHASPSDSLSTQGSSRYSGPSSTTGSSSSSSSTSSSGSTDDTTYTSESTTTSDASGSTSSTTQTEDTSYSGSTGQGSSASQGDAWN